MWKLILIGFVITGTVVAWVNRRSKRLLEKENRTREKLGLPILSEAEFAIDPVEKSVDYRGKINQHM